MPGERITLKTREKIRELKKENWVKEEEKEDEEAEEAIYVHLVGCTASREVSKGKSSFPLPFSSLPPPPPPPPPSSSLFYPLWLVGCLRDKGCVGLGEGSKEGECLGAQFRDTKRSNAAVVATATIDDIWNR